MAIFGVLFSFVINKAFDISLKDFFNRSICIDLPQVELKKSREQRNRACKASDRASKCERRVE